MSSTLIPSKLADAQPLPDEWVRRLFQKLSARYGTLFSDRYAGVPHEVLVREWACELAGYSAQELQRGLDALRANKFPPSLPEFLELCRPGLDPHEAYVEAMRLMPLRGLGQNPEWSHPAIYWAVVHVTHFDMRQTTYAVIKGRWERALAEQLRRGSWPPIPRAHIPLPPPNKKAGIPPVIAAQMQGLLQKLCKGKRSQ